MSIKISYAEISEKILFFLLLLSMLLTKDLKAADFPVYSLLLLLAVLGWAAAGFFLNKGAGISFLPVRYRSDLMVLFAIGYEVAAMMGKLFRDPDKGEIDFSGNAEALAFAALYLLISSGMKFRQNYFDMILYGGLLFETLFLYAHVTGAAYWKYGELVLKDAGAAAACFLLVCMVGVYQYCTCKDRLRSLFYFAVSAVSFLALALNRNTISLWLMALYFLAVPVLLRPTARLVKKDMQMLFLFGFLLSNMSLLTNYTGMFVTDIAFSLEHSVYLDLLLACGGILFFHYWEKIPEGIDLERLVMRKMRRTYKYLFMVGGIFFTGIVFGADRWTALGEKMPDKIWKSFALPLVEAVKQSESGFYACFQETGVIAGIFIVMFLVLLMSRMRRNYGMDRPLTGGLILITIFFMIQLLFYRPAANTLTVYVVLLLFAAFYREEKSRMVSVRIRGETLRRQDGKELEGKCLEEKGPERKIE